MDLKTFIIKNKWAIGFAEIRRFINSGCLLINGEIPKSIDVKLNKGDVITLGKNKRSVFNG